MARILEASEFPMISYSGFCTIGCATGSMSLCSFTLKVQG